MATETEDASGGTDAGNGKAPRFPPAKEFQGISGLSRKVGDKGFTILAEGDRPIVE